jgi:hypothetical protein
MLMVTNDQIRRAKPTVDSPLGRLIRGEIDQKEYQRLRREQERREREAAAAGSTQLAR